MGKGRLYEKAIWYLHKILRAIEPILIIFCTSHPTWSAYLVRLCVGVLLHLIFPTHFESSWISFQCSVIHGTGRAPTIQFNDLVRLREGGGEQGGVEAFSFFQYTWRTLGTILIIVIGFI